MTPWYASGGVEWEFTPCSHNGLLGVPIYPSNNPKVQLLNYYNKDGYSVGACESFGSLHRDDWDFTGGDNQTMILKIWDHCTYLWTYLGGECGWDIDPDWDLWDMIAGIWSPSIEWNCDLIHFDSIGECFAGSLMNHILCNGEDYSGGFGLTCDNDERFSTRGILNYTGLPSLPGVVPCDYTDLNQSIECADIGSAFNNGDGVDIGLFKVPLSAASFTGPGQINEMFYELYVQLHDQFGIGGGGMIESFTDAITDEDMGGAHYFDNPACAHGNCRSTGVQYENATYGCTNFGAINYNPDANIDDASCEFAASVPQETFLNDMIRQHRKIKFSVNQSGKLYQTNHDFWIGIYPEVSYGSSATSPHKLSFAMDNHKIANHKYHGWNKNGGEMAKNRFDETLLQYDPVTTSVAGGMEIKGSMDRMALWYRGVGTDTVDAWNDHMISTANGVFPNYTYQNTDGSLFWNKDIHIKKSNWLWNGGVCDADFDLPLYDRPCIDADGNEYKTVRIGVQLWMAENLRTTRYHRPSSQVFSADVQTPGVCVPAVDSGLGDTGSGICGYERVYNPPYVCTCNDPTNDHDSCNYQYFTESECIVNCGGASASGGQCNPVTNPFTPEYLYDGYTFSSCNELFYNEDIYGDENNYYSGCITHSDDCCWYEVPMEIIDLTLDSVYPNGTWWNLPYEPLTFLGELISEGDTPIHQNFNNIQGVRIDRGAFKNPENLASLVHDSYDEDDNSKY